MIAPSSGEPGSALSVWVRESLNPWQEANRATRRQEVKGLSCSCGDLVASLVDDLENCWSDGPDVAGYSREMVGGRDRDRTGDPLLANEIQERYVAVFSCLYLCRATRFLTVFGSTCSQVVPELFFVRDPLSGIGYSESFPYFLSNNLGTTSRPLSVSVNLGVERTERF